MKPLLGLLLLTFINATTPGTAFAQDDQPQAEDAEADLREARERLQKELQERQEQAAAARLAAMQQVMQLRRQGIVVRRWSEILKPPDRFGAAPADVEPVTPDVDGCRDRLQVHAAAFRQWTDQLCGWSPVQRDRVDEILKEKLESLRENVAENRNGPARLLPDCAPLMFTQDATTWNCLVRSRVTQITRGVLTEKQHTDFVTLLDERRDFIRAANLQYIVSLVDEEIRLTPEQYGPFSEALRDRIGHVHHRLADLDAGLFVFHGEQAPLGQRSLDLLLNNLAGDVLTPGQQGVLNYLAPRPKEDGARQTRVRLNIDSDPPTDFDKGMRRLEVQIIGALPELREQFDADVQRKVAALEARWDLSPQARRKLVVAGKGATEKCLADWKSGLLEHHGFTREQRTFGFVAIHFGLRYTLFTFAALRLMPSTIRNSGSTPWQWSPGRLRFGILVLFSGRPPSATSRRCWTGNSG
ncbi:MAG: hypothetical protein R3C19_09355 [Planctomycetaceae bacterium]